ncbi:MAG: NADH-quinone oxidoreductase subunit N, partial [Muribaculaceae bacterium]|nr:NADH-quinone oxidoreductase subunit N [Muribaculaceae bacterium]
MDYSQFLVMSQEIGLVAVFLLIFLFDTFAPRKALGATAPLACVLFAAFTIVNICLPCFRPEAVEPQSAFGGMYVTNKALFMIKNILNVGVLIVLIQSIKWVNSPDQIMRRGEFFELLLVTLFGMYLMMSSRHFLTFIIGLESASLPLAAMVAFEKKKYESHEAAIKYLLTAVFSSAILLMGISFVYALSGSLYFADIAESIVEECPLLVVALAFVLAGVGFKLSLVPFHLWTADVYQGAPTSVTSYLSVISKGATAIAAFIIFALAFEQFYAPIWYWMLYALIILTITIGNLFAIRQKNMKRFLAFSSISQAGYIMLGLIAGSPDGLTSM